MKNQKAEATSRQGFALLAALLIVLGLAALGGGGYIVYQKFIQKEEAEPQENQNQANTQDVSEPTEEDVIRTFFSLVDEGKASDAVGMMSENMAKDDATKQSWGVSLNGFESVKVKSIERVNDGAGSSDQVHVYQTVLDVKLKEDSQLINWDNGENMRWVSILNSPMTNGEWQLYEIATGP